MGLAYGRALGAGRPSPREKGRVSCRSRQAQALEFRERRAQAELVRLSFATRMRSTLIHLDAPILKITRKARPVFCAKRITVAVSLLPPSFSSCSRNVHGIRGDLPLSGRRCGLSRARHGQRRSRNCARRILGLLRQWSLRALTSSTSHSYFPFAQGNSDEKSEGGITQRNCCPPCRK
jgi:hypothetical protein